MTICFYLRPGTIITHTSHLETSAHMQKCGSGLYGYIFFMFGEWRAKLETRDPNQKDPGRLAQPGDIPFGSQFGSSIMM